MIPPIEPPQGWTPGPKKPRTVLSSANLFGPRQGEPKNGGRQAQIQIGNQDGVGKGTLTHSEANGFCLVSQRMAERLRTNNIRLAAQISKVSMNG